MSRNVQKIKIVAIFICMTSFMSCYTKETDSNKEIRLDEALGTIHYTVLDTLILWHQESPDTLIVGYLDDTNSIIVHKNNVLTNYYYRALNCFSCSKSRLGTYKGAKVDGFIVGFAQSIEQVEDTVYVDFENYPIVKEIVQYRSEVFEGKSGKQKYQLIPKDKLLPFQNFIYTADLKELNANFKINKQEFKPFD